MTDLPQALEDVFCTLDRWRHLPAYRLEPAVAPFFGLFLRDILGCKLRVKGDCVIIPEFPLSKEMLRKSPLCKSASDQNDAKKNLSVKVDYAVFSEDFRRALFVELKTDRGSFNDTQLKYLGCARNVGLDCLVDGIIKICGSTNQKRKYVHLLRLLAKASLINGHCSSLFEEAIATNRLRDGCRWDNVLHCEPIRENPPRNIDIVYITPDGQRPNENDLQKACLDKDDVTNISFGEVVDVVKNRGKFGCMFAGYLDRWKEPAGVLKSQNICTGK